MKTVKIAFIRHSVTEWNEEGRIQGHFNSPLTEHGRELAAGWRETLEPHTFDAVLTSDLGRTIETANIITEGLELPTIQLPGLREQDWGEWSGLTMDELHAKFPGKLDEEVAKGWHFTPNNGENRTECAERGLKALEEGITEVLKTIDKDEIKILTVAHEGVIKSVIYKLLDHDFMPEERKLLKRRRLHWLNWNGKLSIARLNDEL
ncbi:histidine phosphatase family protein [Maridesulfovibrio salexigens]|uniref:phosphoglycerate mutase (2,3-diphosphoglycerate-dependent) n=1 Tax=Maridesulfovibrio salexigens (strain ATCC 14822 / DSM 2638 / NCIMB 8403 / VKM B-1763) TaxID=526222 RepID=C6BTP5_MARSD|nr:histidine phosphatase family protein [Maridesulfovibrio salexigens]ACS79825.1 Phosphoglycerate mutase [Maridesulfovibrio salexigens DSM 2638]